MEKNKLENADDIIIEPKYYEKMTREELSSLQKYYCKNINSKAVTLKLISICFLILGFVAAGVVFYYMFTYFVAAFNYLYFHIASLVMLLLIPIGIYFENIKSFDFDRWLWKEHDVIASKRLVFPYSKKRNIDLKESKVFSTLTKEEKRRLGREYYTQLAKGEKIYLWVMVIFGSIGFLIILGCWLYEIIMSIIHITFTHWIWIDPCYMVATFVFISLSVASSEFNQFYAWLEYEKNIVKKAETKAEENKGELK